MTYLRIGALVAFLALAATAFWYRGNAISAEAKADRLAVELQKAADANDSLVAANNRLIAQNAINDRVLLGIANELAKINAGVSETTESIEGLKNASEDVRAYLAGLVPADLRLQLER